MNERLNELAEQAGAGKQEGYEVLYLTFNPDALKKFAELIVIEMCNMMEHCEDDVYHCSEPSELSDYTGWLYDWQTRFKEHFGVEE